MEDAIKPPAASPIGRRRWLGASALALAGLTLEGCAERLPAERSARAGIAATGRIRLDLNENPFGPSPRAVEAIRRGLVDLARYTSSEAEDLQRQVAAAEGVPFEQVVLGDVLEAIAIHLALAGGAGGEFVYSTPGYAAFADSARTAGGTAVAMPLDPRLENDLPSLLSKVGDRTRALFIVNPHNPSGTVSDSVALKTMLREASTRALVLVDEAYLEFTEDFSRRSCVDLVRAGNHVAVFRTFSKIHGLAALPFGYAVLPLEWANRLRAEGVGSPRSLDRLAVAAASASLGDASFIAWVRAKVAEERAQWFATFRTLNLRFADSRGNFVFFETGRPHREFAEAMLGRGVDVGRAFPPLDRWARISIGLPEENARAREVLRTVLR
ncbi:MAG: histidinol-phosphate transaminase [Polyangiaceae bacterium]|jgi:histidinol-phosphate aminotransferase